MEPVKVEYNNYFDRKIKGVILGVMKDQTFHTTNLIVLCDDGRIIEEKICDIRNCKIVENEPQKKHR